MPIIISYSKTAHVRLNTGQNNWVHRQRISIISAIASLSGLAYMKYSQNVYFGKKVEELNQKGQLKKYLFDVAEQSSYFNDDLMLNLEKSYNISHVNKYKSTLFRFVEGKTLQTCAGTNRNLKYYAPGTDLTLIDWSPKMASMGIAKSLPSLSFNYVIGDVTKMPFKDNQFDTVIDVFGLQHVIEPRQALKQIRRVCKKNGNILLMNIGLSSILQFHYWQNAVSAKTLYKSGIFTNRNWQKLVKDFDFQIKFSQRKKNGKFYIYVLKNIKQKSMQQTEQANKQNIGHDAK